MKASGLLRSVRRLVMGETAERHDEPEAGSPTARRYLETLEQLLELPGADLKTTLIHACDLVAAATGSDKVDAFLYDPTRDSLVAVGTSSQPLSMRQRQLGLDVLPVSNGGRAVHVYRSGRTFITGRLDEDPEEIRGIKEGLGIRSKLGVPLVVAGARRGMMMLASQRADFFTDDDVRFAEAVGRWTATIAHRAELVGDIGRNAAELGRRAAAEELVTVLAHDLRNLVAPLDLRLHVLQRRATADGRHEDVRDLNVAHQAIARLRRLIADILDVARIDQGLFQGVLEPLDVPALITETARMLETPEHRINVLVMATGDLLVAADRERLRQCVENLLGNAIQKSPKDAPVDVLVAEQRLEKAAWAVVEIIDQGPGVPEEILPRIFDRFWTGSDREGGLGLGLYLAKQIAEMHGGDLTVDRHARAGARFVLTLPCVTGG
jgi:signal transduction histidine kinase